MASLCNSVPIRSSTDYEAFDQPQPASSADSVSDTFTLKLPPSVSNAETRLGGKDVAENRAENTASASQNNFWLADESFVVTRDRCCSVLERGTKGGRHVSSPDQLATSASQPITSTESDSTLPVSSDPQQHFTESAEVAESDCALTLTQPSNLIVTRLIVSSATDGEENAVPNAEKKTEVTPDAETESATDTDTETNLRGRRDLVWLKALGFDAITQRLARDEEVPIDMIDTITFMSERQKDAVRRRVSTVNESIRKRKSLEPTLLQVSGFEFPHSVACVSTDATILESETNHTGKGQLVPTRNTSTSTFSESVSSGRRHSALGLMSPIGVRLTDSDDEATTSARIPPRTREGTPERRTFHDRSVRKSKCGSIKQQQRNRRKSSKLIAIERKQLLSGCGVISSASASPVECERNVAAEMAAKISRNRNSSLREESRSKATLREKGSVEKLTYSLSSRRKNSASSSHRKSSGGSGHKVSRAMPIPRISITFEAAAAAAAAAAAVASTEPQSSHVTQKRETDAANETITIELINEQPAEEPGVADPRYVDADADIEAEAEVDDSVSSKRRGGKLRRFFRRIFHPRLRRAKGKTDDSLADSGSLPKQPARSTQNVYSVRTDCRGDNLRENDLRPVATNTNTNTNTNVELPARQSADLQSYDANATALSNRHSIAVAVAVADPGTPTLKADVTAPRLNYSRSAADSVPRLVHSQSATPRRSIANTLRERLRVARSAPTRRISASSTDCDAYDLADVINTRWHGEFLGAETSFLPISRLTPRDDYVLRIGDKNADEKGQGLAESVSVSVSPLTVTLIGTEQDQLPEYELIGHECGITLISDLRPGSKETQTQIEELRRFVLLELTGLFDEQEMRCKIALPDLYKHARWTTAFRKQKEHQSVFGASLWALLEADAARNIRRVSQQQSTGGANETVDDNGGTQARRHSLSEKRQSTSTSADVGSTQNRSTAKRRSEPDSSLRPEDAEPDASVVLTDAVSGSNLNVPSFLRQLVAHLRAHCLLERGLFRVAAQAGRVRALMQTIDEDFYRAGSRFILSDSLRNKPHDAADLLKKFLKHLHPPLLTRELIGAFRAVGRIRDLRTQVEALNMLTLLLPEPNRNALLLVLSLLDDVARNSAVNKMTLHNLATVFAPTILYDHRDPSAAAAINPLASVGQNIAASAVALGAMPAFLATSRSISSNSLVTITTHCTQQRSASNAAEITRAPGTRLRSAPLTQDRPAAASSILSSRSKRLSGINARSAQNLAVSSVPPHSQSISNLGLPPSPSSNGVPRSSSASSNTAGTETAAAIAAAAAAAAAGTGNGGSQMSLTGSDIIVMKLLVYYHRLLAVVPTKFIMQLRAYLRLRYLVADVPPPPKVPDDKRLPCTIAQRLSAALFSDTPSSSSAPFEVCNESRSNSRMQMAPAISLHSGHSDSLFEASSTPRPSSPECDPNGGPASPAVRCSKMDSFRSERLAIDARPRGQSSLPHPVKAMRASSAREYARTYEDNSTSQKLRLAASNLRHQHSLATRLWPFRSTRGSRRLIKRSSRASDATCRQDAIQFIARQSSADPEMRSSIVIGAEASNQFVASLEIERRRIGEVYPLIIRVHAPNLGISRKMIDVSMKPKVRDIIGRFFRATTPRTRMHFLNLPTTVTNNSVKASNSRVNDEENNDARLPILNDAGTCLPEDLTADGQPVTYLYEVGAGIGEMRLDPDANMWDVYLRNPLARWIIK